MATTLERPKLTAEQTYRARDVARLLSVSRATFYRIAWFKGKRVKVAAGCVGYLASDVALYQAMRRGA